jgi:hypothetical protein
MPIGVTGAGLKTMLHAVFASTLIPEEKSADSSGLEGFVETFRHRNVALRFSQ